MFPTFLYFFFYEILTLNLKWIFKDPILNDLNKSLGFKLFLNRELIWE